HAVNRVKQRREFPQIRPVDRDMIPRHPTLETSRYDGLAFDAKVHDADSSTDPKLLTGALHHALPRRNHRQRIRHENNVRGSFGDGLAAILAIDEMDIVPTLLLYPLGASCEHRSGAIDGEYLACCADSLQDASRVAAGSAAHFNDSVAGLQLKLVENGIASEEEGPARRVINTRLPAIISGHDLAVPLW